MELGLIRQLEINRFNVNYFEAAIKKKPIQDEEDKDDKVFDKDDFDLEDEDDDSDADSDSDGGVDFDEGD